MTKDKQSQQQDFSINEEEKPQSFLEKIRSQLELRIAMKAGIAATISLYVGVEFARALDRPNLFLSGAWCVMSTFTVLQARLGGTYQAAWIRFLGVLIGSFMGSIFTSLFGSNAFTLGISIFLTVLLCSLFRLKESVRIACLSVSIVSILWGIHPSISPWTFGLYRLQDSSLGILIAVLVSHTFWPEQATQKMRLQISNILHNLNRLFQLELSLKPPPKHFDKIHKKLVKDTSSLIGDTKQILKESELELMTKVRSLEEWSQLIDYLKDMLESTLILRTFQEFDLLDILDQELKDKLDETMEKTVKTFKELSGQLKSREIKEPSFELRNATDRLNEELNRFRLTRTTRLYDRADVERFFVFFYHLRSVIEYLLRVQDKVIVLNSQSAIG